MELQWWGWVLLIITALVYVVVTGLIAWSAQSLVKDYTTDAARYKKAADRFTDQLKLRTAGSSYYENLEKRRDEHTRLYRKKRIQAKFAYATFVTCFAWPLWLVFYVLVSFLTLIFQLRRSVKST